MSDAELFQSVVSQMQQGSSYYAAMGSTLRDHHFASASLFNWRPPLLYLTLSLFPQPLPAWAYFSEVWAGLLLLAGMLCRYRLRIFFLVLAVLVRELAGPAFLICLFLDWNDYHSSERSFWWMVGSGIIAAYYAAHGLAVHGSQVAGAIVPVSWIAFGGPRFLLQTWELLLPREWAILWGFLILAVVFSRRVPKDLRWVIGSYLVLFSMIGRPDNPYWGLVIWPTQVLGVCIWLRELV